MKTHLLLPALLLLAACGDKDGDDTADIADDSGATDTDATNPDLPDYSQPGPYAVGTMDAEIVGSTGVDLKVQVWFPADAPGTETVVYDFLLDGNAYTDVSPSCAESHPVLLFSHGYGGVRWQSGYLMEHLASHGYMVVAPDHTFNTIFDDDGSKFEEVLVRRPQDIADSFDWAVSQSDDSSNAMAGCINEADGYAVSGHSFGGYTTYAAAGATLSNEGETFSLGDDRVWAAAPLAPWHAYLLLDGGTADITVPVMTLSGTRDETTTWDEVTDLHGALTVSPRYLGEFPDGGHYSFAPLACDFAYEGDGCGDDFIALDVAASLTSTAVVVFLEETRGMTGAIQQLPVDDALIWTAE